MSRTFVQTGDSIDAIAGGGGVRSGSPVVYGALFGIPEDDAAEGEIYSLTLVGVHVLPKASGQINAGARVWWDPANGKVVNASSAGHYPIGCAAKAADSSDALCYVRLDGVAVVAAGA